MDENNKEKETKSVADSIKKNKVRVILAAAAVVLLAVIITVACKSCGGKSGGEGGSSNESIAQSESTDGNAMTEDEKDTVRNGDDGKNTDEGKNEEKNEAPGAAASETEVPQITPIFMYFVSKSDEGYNEYMAMLDELKAEYDGRVEFQITDVDENPEAKENFPTEGNTPLLIMNNHDNNITAIEFKCADKEKLKEDIEASFK